MIEIDGRQEDIFKKDWDMLVILDACRYDAFIESDILLKNHEIKRANTFCNGTFSWIKNNITPADCSETIYLNPIILFERYARHTFFKVINVWEILWDNYYGTILPDDMTKITLKQIKKYPNKRFIIHYHQPHPPFLNQEFRKHKKVILTPKLVQDRDNGKVENPSHTFGGFVKGQMVRIFGPERAWKLMFRVGIEPNGMGQLYKYFSMEQIKEAYRENIRIALRSVNKLISETDKKVVITSDHSYDYYGRKVKRGECVPWVEIK